MKEHWETLRTGALGILGSAGGFTVSIMPAVECWLRFASLVLGIIVAILSIRKLIRDWSK